MMFRPDFNSVTTRIIVFGLIILIVGSIGWTLLLSNYLRNDIIRMNSTQLLTLANYAASDIDRNIVERRELLKNIAAKLPLEHLNNPARLREWLAGQHHIYPLFSQGLFVIAPSGTLKCDYPAAALNSGTSYADRDYFIKAMQGQFTIGRPVQGIASKIPVLPMGTSICDKNGKVCAVLAGVSALTAPNFLEALHKTRIGTEGGLILVSPQDELFVDASHRDIALTTTPPKGTHLQHDRAMQGFRGVGIDVNMGGIEELAAVVSVPSSGWFLVARMPTEEVFAPITRLHRLIAGNTAILTIASIIVLIAGLRYLLGPLRQAAHHADRMTSGEIPLEPLPVARKDEVGNLTQAFNRVLTKLLESRAEMEHLAHHDTLTGLPNRKLLTDNMQQALARSRRQGTLVAVLFLDMDGFKQVNDRLGHDAGDMALQQVAVRLQEIVRREDTLARVGGDEFIILLADQHDNARDTAELVARKCLAAFQHPFDLKGEICPLGVSIGIAISTGERQPDKLLNAADRAMYVAKEADGEKIGWADEESMTGDRGERGVL